MHIQIYTCTPSEHTLRHTAATHVYKKSLLPPSYIYIYILIYVCISIFFNVFLCIYICVSSILKVYSISIIFLKELYFWNSPTKVLNFPSSTNVHVRKQSGRMVVAEVCGESLRPRLWPCMQPKSMI